MKLTTATSILASSVATTNGSLRKNDNNADVNPSTIRRQLAASLQRQHDVTAELKKRRSSKKDNGKIFRHLRNKLQNSMLINLVEAEESDLSAFTENTNDDLDFGALSRDLQEGDVNVTESVNTVIDDLYELCTSNQTDPEFSCECYNLDVGGYTASVSCAYAEKCLSPTVNSCGDNVTFCFVETYNLEVSAPGSGKSSICYNVSTPMTFDYCYGLTYTDESDAPAGCVLEVNGTECSTCEFTVSEINPNVTCNNFDCSNVDKDISTGSICDDDTIVSLKIEDYLTYGALPCEGGCNICPLGGKMTNLDNNVTIDDNVTMISGDTYYCYQLNLAALLGYLDKIPGDLCNALPAVVDEPCGCTGGTSTASPVSAPTSETITASSASANNVAINSLTTGAPVAALVPAPIEVPTLTDSPVSDPVMIPAESGAGNNGFAVATAVATTLGWIAVKT